jgi:hypothetical protein
LTCIRVVVGHERPLGEGCSAPQTDPGAVPTTAREHCNPSGLLLTGVAGPNVRGIDAVLGDGTLRRVPLDRLPASFGDPRRAYALGPESGTAVRSLRIHLLQRVQTLPLERAPGGATCRPGLSNQAEFLVGGFATEAQAAPVGPLVARDDGDRLCVGLGTIVPEDCQIPPIDALLPRIDVRRAGGQTALLAVVAPEVASLRLELDRGAPVTVAATDLPGYAGRYAGLVHGLAVPLPAGAHVYATDELAADGHVLQHSSGPDLRPLAHAPAVLARLPGRVVVAASSSSCIQVGVKAPTRDASQCHGGVETTFAFAPCAARRLVILARSRQLRVTTDRGVIRGRRIGGFAVAIVPPSSAATRCRSEKKDRRRPLHRRRPSLHDVRRHVGASTSWRARRRSPRPWRTSRRPIDRALRHGGRRGGRCPSSRRRA